MGAKFTQKPERLEGACLMEGIRKLQKKIEEGVKAKNPEEVPKLIVEISSPF